MSTRGIVDAGSERIPKSVNGEKNGHANGVPINGAQAPQLRPFFGYYGGKWRDALKHYPEPDHETIVEPFAGSAGFSLRYAHHKIILCEIDPILSEVLALRLPRDPPPDADHSAGSSVGLRCWRIARGRSDLRA